MPACFIPRAAITCDAHQRSTPHSLMSRAILALSLRQRIDRTASRLPSGALSAMLLIGSLTAAHGVQGQTRSTSDSTASAPRLATPGAIARDARAFAKRVGLWGAASMGRGSAGLRCAACQSDQSAAFAGTLSIGGRAHPRFHVGVETWAWLDVIGNGVDRMARGTQLIARHYPLANRALHVTGGAGTSRFSVDDGDTRFDATSPALTLGLGWDMPYRGVMLSPAISVVASTGGALTSSRTGNNVAENARLGLWRSTLSITWF